VIYRIPYSEDTVRIYKDKKYIGRLDHNFEISYHMFQPRTSCQTFKFYPKNKVNPSIITYHLCFLIEKIEKEYNGILEKKELLKFEEGRGWCRMHLKNKGGIIK